MWSKPKFLYKYLAQEGAQQLFNSETPSIWFSLPRTFNDPYDLNPADDVGSRHPANQIFVLCLCETPISIPMWGHYAQGRVENSYVEKSLVMHGGGVVLEFSMASEFFKDYPPRVQI